MFNMNAVIPEWWDDDAYIHTHMLSFTLRDIGQFKFLLGKINI